MKLISFRSGGESRDTNDYEGGREQNGCQPCPAERGESFHQLESFLKCWLKKACKLGGTVHICQFDLTLDINTKLCAIFCQDKKTLLRPSPCLQLKTAIVQVNRFALKGVTPGGNMIDKVCIKIIQTETRMYFVPL